MFIAYRESKGPAGNRPARLPDPKAATKGLNVADRAQLPCIEEQNLSNKAG